MSLCLSGIKIEKTVLDITWLDGPLLTGGEPLDMVMGLGQRVEGGTSPARDQGPLSFQVAWCRGV